MNQRQISIELKCLWEKTYPWNLEKSIDQIEEIVDEYFIYDENNDQVYLKVDENHIILIHEDDVLFKIVQLLNDQFIYAQLDPLLNELNV